MTTSFYELIGLAVLYARVSTTTEGQKDSCKNQLSLGVDFLKKHLGLICAGEYVDDGITGATNYRPAFNDMIERIKCGDIRYIITKNEERLCRSTEIDGYLQSMTFVSSFLKAIQYSIHLITNRLRCMALRQ